MLLWQGAAILVSSIASSCLTIGRGHCDHWSTFSNLESIPFAPTLPRFGRIYSFRVNTHATIPPETIGQDKIDTIDCGFYYNDQLYGVDNTNKMVYGFDTNGAFEQVAFEDFFVCPKKPLAAGKHCATVATSLDLLPSGESPD